MSRTLPLCLQAFKCQDAIYADDNLYRSYISTIAERQEILVHRHHEAISGTLFTDQVSGNPTYHQERQ